MNDYENREEYITLQEIVDDLNELLPDNIYVDILEDDGCFGLQITNGKKEAVVAEGHTIEEITSAVGGMIMLAWGLCKLEQKEEE